MAKSLFAYSVKTSRVREPDFPYHGQRISCTYMDAQNKVICIQIMSGTVNQAVVYPREVIRHALLAGSSAIILIHNHPSGEVRPSEADIRLTKHIQEAAKFLDVLVHDHIIIGDNKFFSFREEGLMPIV